MIFRFRTEQRLPAANAHVGPGCFGIFILAAEGRLGSLLPCDVILLFRQLRPPLRVRLLNFFAHAPSLHRCPHICEHHLRAAGEHTTAPAWEANRPAAPEDRLLPCDLRSQCTVKIAAISPADSSNLHETGWPRSTRFLPTHRAFSQLNPLRSARKLP